MMRVGRLSLSDVCLSRTLGLSREQRGLGRLKLAEASHVTRDSDTTFKVKRSKVNLQGAGAYCGGLPHSLFRLTSAEAEVRSMFCVKFSISGNY